MWKDFLVLWERVVAFRVAIAVLVIGVLRVVRG